MEERLEDAIFASALEASGIKLTKNKYERTEYPHICTLCGEDTGDYLAYKLKPEYVTGDDTPYLFICDECYEDLTND